jgi:MerR family transcriptional regulator, redox-sensitive transcriptional activator SoxR
MSLSTYLSVGDVSKRCNVNISAIHFYERKGLICSSRNEGNQRRFSRDVLRRISIIKAAQQVGISLENIKIAFASLPDNRTPTKKDWQRLANQWKDELDYKIRYLTNLRDSLTGCIGCGCLSMDDCPLYNPEDKLAELEVGGPILLDTKSKSSE